MNYKLLIFLSVCLTLTGCIEMTYTCNKEVTLDTKHEVREPGNKRIILKQETICVDSTVEYTND